MKIAADVELLLHDSDHQRRLGLAIQAMRLSKELEIVDLSELSGVHRNTIRRAEVGEHRISIRNLTKLAAACGTKAWVVMRTAEELRM